MPDKPLNPRNYPEARLLREIEPYHFERKRHQLGEFPRPAQPNTSQPNQKPAPIGFGMTQEDYYKKVYENYLKGRR